MEETRGGQVWRTRQKLPRRQTASSVSERVTNHLPLSVVSRPCAIRVTTARTDLSRTEYRVARVSGGPYYGLLSGSKPHIHDPGTGHEREANLRYHLPSSPSLLSSFSPLPFSPSRVGYQLFQERRKRKKTIRPLSYRFSSERMERRIDRFHEKQNIQVVDEFIAGPVIIR